MTELALWQIIAVVLYALSGLVYWIEAEQHSPEAPWYVHFAVAWTWPVWAVVGIVLVIRDK